MDDRLRCRALGVLMVFFASLASSFAGEAALADEANPSHVTHEGGPSCPDPGGGGDPCGPGCPCTCCPGHRPPIAFCSCELSIFAPPADELISASPAELHPREIGQRIFHPPRA